MKFFKYLALIIIVALVSFVFTLNVYPSLREKFIKPDPAAIIKSAYYRIKASIYEAMPKQDNSIVFLGDSLTDYVQFREIFPDFNTKNRGIAGDTTVGVLNRLNAVINEKPAKLFVLIGTNDIVFGTKPIEIAANIRKIIERVKEGSPETKIYVETLFPVNPSFGDDRRSNKTIREINSEIVKIAAELKCELIDTYNFMAENDELPSRYTIDGIHFNGAGILHWMEFLAPYVKE